jgi:probable HAF family extracellular repeat protein
MHFRLRAASLVILSLGFVSAGWSANPQYTVTDLGALNPAYGTFAKGINSKGEVVGYGGADATHDHAFRYSNGTMTDLGTMGGSNSRAYGIGDAGLIGGDADTFSSTSKVAMIYSGGNMSALATFGGSASSVNAISPNGTIAGSSRPFGDGGFRAFIRFPNGGIGQVPFLTGTDVANFGYATNDLGYTVGVSQTAGMRNVAYIYGPGFVLPLDSRASLDSYAVAVNSVPSMVVGSAVFAGGVTHAASFVTNTVPVDLGTLPGGTNSEALGVNDSKTIVGGSSIAGSYHGFVIPDFDASTALLDLNDLIAGGTTFTIENASAINASGQIAASGSENGGPSHALLLTPVGAPAPTPAAPTVSTKKSLKSSKSSLTIKGSASGSVTSVTYKAGSKTGTASGTTSWHFKAKLKGGKSIVTVIAHGPGGDSAPVKITITRR